MKEISIQQDECALCTVHCTLYTNATQFGSEVEEYGVKLHLIEFRLL